MNVAAKLHSTLRLIALAVLQFAIWFHPARAADISQAGTNIFFSGRIEKGDLERLARKVAEAQIGGVTSLTLSLNSDGGSFEESLKLANFVNSTGLPTRVARGEKCLSACAFVFLGGASRMADESQVDISRTLEMGAELGFHLPYAAAGDGAPTVKLERDKTEAAYQLGKVFEQYDVPRSLWTKLLQNDDTHSLYDATTVEAIMLLGITVDVKLDQPPPVTRQMAENICINGLYFSQRKLASADHARALAEIDQLLRIQPIIRPKGFTSAFLLLPTTRALSPNGVQEILTCRVANDGVCQGFFWPEAVKVNTEGEAQEPAYQGCQSVVELPLSVPPTTRLQDVKATVLKMVQTQTALLQPPGPLATPEAGDDEHDAPVTTVDPTPAPLPPPVTLPVSERPAVICNANQTFANVRSGPNSRQFHIVATLPNQTGVKIVGETRNPESNHPWYEISFPSGRGFVDAELVQATCLVAMPVPPPPVVTPQVREAVVCNAGGDSANLRDTPNPKSSVVMRKLFNHETLTITGEANNPDSGHLYFKVRAQGIDGYVDSELVSPSCSLQKAGDTATLEPAVATKVICNRSLSITNLRSGPNRSFNLVASLANETPAEILETVNNPESGHPWLRIRADGLEGYVDSELVADQC
jgi:Bacterial SH3 domain